jgi:hypothetical protein
MKNDVPEVNRLGVLRMREAGKRGFSFGYNEFREIRADAAIRLDGPVSSRGEIYLGGTSFKWVRN